MKPNGGSSQCLKRKRRTGAEGFAADGVVNQAHGLVGKAKNHLVVPNDAAHPQRSDAVALQAENVFTIF